MVNLETSRSRTVDVFIIAAKAYLESCARDYASGIQSTITPSESTMTTHFRPTYRATLGKNMPQARVY